MTEPSEGERYDAMTEAERTEWLVEGVRKAIDEAGGPDKVRFVPVATADIAARSCEADANGEPIIAWFEGTDDDSGLVRLRSRSMSSAGAYTIPTLIEVVRQGRGGKVLIDGVKLPWALGDAGVRTHVVTDGTPTVTLDLIASEVRVIDDSLTPGEDGQRIAERATERRACGVATSESQPESAPSSGVASPDEQR